jgi:alkylglycerol monooxygenase
MTVNPSGLAIPLFVFFMLLEYLVLKLQGKNLHRYNDSINSLSMGMLLLTSDALLKATTFTVFIFLYNEFRLIDFESSQLITWLVFFFGVDFCYYWFHRCAHQYNILWGAHVGHHQSEEYNLTTALRQSAFQYAFSWVFYLPLAILGCPPEVFLVQFVILKLFQFWLHTQLINKVPFIEGIFSTPSSHRVHHAKNPIYIDRNYGGTLVLWDRVFGSWQPELDKEPCHYGTTQPLDTLSPIKANLQHWSLLFRDTLHTALVKDKFKLWFKPTGWRPADCIDQQRKVNLQHDGCTDRKKYDPKTTKLVNVYAGFSLVSISLLAIMFLFNSPRLAALELGASVLSIVLGLTMLSRFLENNLKYAWVEFIRWPVFIAIFWSLATTATHHNISQTIIINKSSEAVFEYVTVPNLWHEWHPQSLSVEPELHSSFQQGQAFDEVIQTSFGKDDMSWVVEQNIPNELWVARAYNHTKGVNIRLRYDLVVKAESTQFTRTLHYEMPNFMLHVANFLYFNKYMTEKSWHSLESLKSFLETNK